MDSAAAEGMRDSLAAAGWDAYIDRAQVGTRRAHHVRILPSDDEMLTTLATPVLRQNGAVDAEVVQETGGHEPATRMVAVRTAAATATRVRWATSPAGDALAVVDESTAANGDPLPSAFVLAGDGDLAALHVEGIWDVAVAPDWRSVAYGLSYLYAPSRALLDRRDWAAIASAAAVGDSVVRRATFPVAGATRRQGLARLVVAPRPIGRAGQAPLPGEGNGPRPGAAPVGGWAVQWSPAGDTLYAQDRPAGVVRAGDASWRAYDPRGMTLLAPHARPGPTSMRWSESPAGTDPHADAAGGVPTLLVGQIWTIHTDGVWLYARRTAAQSGRWLILGPGTSLAISRAGSVVAALAPRYSPSQDRARPPVVEQVPVVYLLPSR
ncbi:MAG: hypothetical protein NVS1B4_06740 [Gemmatimonadaceae bacterium]